MATKVVGIDLAGKEDNNTGYCCLDTDGGGIKTNIVHEDQQLIEQIRQDQPQVIAIDAPFKFPQSGQYRDSDLALQSLGFQPLSPTFPGMRVLVKRAKGLIKQLKKKERDYQVIEVFPRASEKLLGLERNEKADEDQYDALVCALTAQEYLKGDYKSLSGTIIPD